MINRRVILLLLLAFALSGCQSGQSSSDESDQQKVAAIPVEAVALQRGPIVAFYSATGTLKADREARVVPRLAGQIVSVEVEEGDRVERGDVLARVDADRLRIEKMQADADLNRMRQDYDRHLEMHARNLVSTEVFERVKFDYQAQQARVELVELDLSYSAITAPFAGVVSERMIKLGNQVNTSEPIFVVTAMDPLLATLDVPERELARLETNQPVSITLDALPGQTYAGFIQRISPVIDAGSGTFRVTVEVEEKNDRLRPGMFGRFHVIYDERDSVLLAPVEAVAIEDGRASVYVVEDNEAHQRDIEIGYRNNGNYEVVSGLTVGDQVVVLGQAALRDGSKVLVLGDPGLDDPPIVDPTEQSEELEMAGEIDQASVEEEADEGETEAGTQS